MFIASHCSASQGLLVDLRLNVRNVRTNERKPEKPFCSQQKETRQLYSLGPRCVRKLLAWMTCIWFSEFWHQKIIGSLSLWYCKCKRLCKQPKQHETQEQRTWYISHWNEFSFAPISHQFLSSRMGLLVWCWIIFEFDLLLTDISWHKWFPSVSQKTVHKLWVARYEGRRKLFLTTTP